MTGGVVGQPAHGEEPKVGVHRQQCLGQPSTAETGHTVQPNCPKLILSEAHPVTAANRKTFFVGSVPATAECISELRPRVGGRLKGGAPSRRPAASGRPPAAGSRRSFSPQRVASTRRCTRWHEETRFDLEHRPPSRCTSTRGCDRRRRCRRGRRSARTCWRA